MKLKAFVEKNWKSFILVVVGVIVFYTAYASIKNSKETKASEIDMPPVSESVNVKTSPVSRKTIEDGFVYSGSIVPSSTVNVNGTISGKVQSVNFDVGDRVTKGDLLFTIDTKDIEDAIKVSEAAVLSADAGVNSALTNLELANGAQVQIQIENASNAVANAESAIEKAETSLETNKNTIEKAKIAIADAEMALNKAKNDLDTNTILYDSGVISKEALDNFQIQYDKALNAHEQVLLGLTEAESAYQIAELNISDAKLSYEQAVSNYNITANQTPEENIKKMQAGLEQAKAQKQSAQVQLDSNRKKLDDARVTSPISGTILERKIDEGTQYSGTQVAFVIIDLDTVNIEVKVAENIINTIHSGDEVKIKIASALDNMITGYVKSIAPGAETDGTYKVKIELDNRNGILKSGMFAEVNFIKNKSDNSYIISRNSILSELDKKYVYVISNGVAEKVYIETGIETGDEVEVLSGLENGMEIVVEGQAYLNDGSAVNIIEKVTEDTSSELEE